MIIPDYWDEHKEKRKLSSRKQATITRFGWSDLNQDDAKRHAKQLVEDAFSKTREWVVAKNNGIGTKSFYVL